MTPLDPLHQLRDLDRASPQFHAQFRDFLRGNAYQNALPNLENESLAWLVEYLDSVLTSISDHTDPLFQESLRELATICGVRGVLPKSCILPGSLLACPDEGSFDDSKVRIRRVRTHPGRDPQKVKEVFRQVAVTSKHLAHPNIVPLLGVTTEPLQFISDRMPGGNLLEYIEKYPGTDRLSLLSGVAEGLHYLHSCNAIHGDLNGSSILVDATGHAQIADSGLAAVTQDLDLIRKAPAECSQNVRWIAPEILADGGTYSKETDIFSFAGVAIEAFTGAIPFRDKSPNATILAITDGERPPRPSHPSLTDGLWTLIQRCWNREAHLRPHALRISCGFGIPAWKRLIDRPLTAGERSSLINYIFSDREQVEVVGRLRGDDAQTFVDVMDQMLDELGPRLRKKSLSTLCKICGRRALLPRSLQIPVCYDRSGEPLGSGGYADVWMGEHLGRKVAVKVLKVYTTSNLHKVTSRFCKEVMTWKSLRHPHVLPLLGVTMSGRHFAMASEWMVNGNINEFIRTDRDANRFELLGDVAKGLIYMHSQGMVHGDLKGANILIDQNRRACLADFGLLTFVSDPTNLMTSSSFTNAGTTRWMAPELLHPEQFDFEDSRPTKQSDCYALGMVVFEVLGGEPPFACDKEVIVIRKVTDGERPERPEVAWFTDDLWSVMEQCWSHQPNERPTIDVVFECLARVSKVWQPLPPTAETDSNSDESFSTTINHTTGSVPEDEDQGDDTSDALKGGPAILPGPPPSGSLVAKSLYIHRLAQALPESRHRPLAKTPRKGKKKAGRRAAQLKADDAITFAPTTEQLRAALLALQEESVPASVQENEGYFMTQVNLGEEMAHKGSTFIFPSALAYYKALRVCLSPLELLIHYEKSIPPPVFKAVMGLMGMQIVLDLANQDESSSESLGETVEESAVETSSASGDDDDDASPAQDSQSGGISETK